MGDSGGSVVSIDVERISFDYRRAWTGTTGGGGFRLPSTGAKLLGTAAVGPAQRHVRLWRRMASALGIADGARNGEIAGAFQDAAASEFSVNRSCRVA